MERLTKQELFEKCEALGLTHYKSKNKTQLIALIAGAAVASAGACAAACAVACSAVAKSIDNSNTNSNTIGQRKFIDLFCGIGGFHQALMRLRLGEEEEKEEKEGKMMKCVFASDIDAACRTVYETNYGVLPAGDITKVSINDSIPEFDILCGGFPCQSFSNSGKKKGFDDPRGNLFENILQIATLRRPSFMFLENVKHIQKINNGEVYRHILKRITETGYVVSDYTLSPHQLGVPQQRERVIFVCIRADLYDPAKPLVITPPADAVIDVTQIFEKNVAEKYRISKEVDQVLSAWDEMIRVFDVGETLSPTIMCNEFYTSYTPLEFNALPVWKQDYITKNKPLYTKYKDAWDAWYTKHKALLTKREIYGKLEWQVGKKKENDSIFNYFIQLRQSGIRVKKAHYFPTLVAIVQTPIYAKEKRHITPRECARLQSFPDSFIIPENDHTAYKQFGNAVNVDVVHFVIRETLKTYGWVV
jgi:DNA (cytosine-5)-methyltransferase 1